MSDRDRLQQAFKETFDMRTTPGFRQAVISRAAVARDARQSSRFAFALGAAAAVLLIAGATAALLLHSVPAPTAPAGHPKSSTVLTPTAAQLDALAKSVYPQTTYGYYGVCDVAGNQALCPFTPRLQTQLTALRASACIGCQNGSNTFTEAAAPKPGGGAIKVSLFNGATVLSLVVVEQTGSLLVDDIVLACPDGSGISVYSMHVTGGPPGQMPYGLAPSCATTP